MLNRSSSFFCFLNPGNDVMSAILSLLIETLVYGFVIIFLVTFLIWVTIFLFSIDNPAQTENYERYGLNEYQSSMSFYRSSVWYLFFFDMFRLQWEYNDVRKIVTFPFYFSKREEMFIGSFSWNSFYTRLILKLIIFFIFFLSNSSVYYAVEIPTLTGVDTSFYVKFADASAKHSHRMIHIMNYFSRFTDDELLLSFLSTEASSHTIKLNYFNSVVMNSGVLFDNVNVEHLSDEYMGYSNLFDKGLSEMSRDELIWHFGLCICKASELYIYEIVHLHNHESSDFSSSDSVAIRQLIYELDKQQFDFRMDLKIFMRRRNS